MTVSIFASAAIQFFNLAFGKILDVTSRIKLLTDYQNTSILIYIKTAFTVFSTVLTPTFMQWNLITFENDEYITLKRVKVKMENVLKVSIRG